MDESLRKLGLAYVDLYLIHWPVAGSDKFLEAWRAMIEMKQDGRARSIGVSNFTEANLSRLIKDSGVTPAVNQIELHPDSRSASCAPSMSATASPPNPGARWPRARRYRKGDPGTGAQA